MQGGIHPDLPGSFYFDLLDAVKAAAPDIHIHAFSPMEVLNGATKLGISFREFLQECRRHGLGTIPGTAAEILDDDVRWVLTQGQAARRRMGGDRPNRPRPGDPQLVDDHVRARRRAPALGFPHPAARADPTRHGRIHRVRPAPVRAPERADLPRRQGATRSLVRRQPADARRREGPARRSYPQRAGLVGEDGRRSVSDDAERRRERLRRHADGRNDQPHGRRGVGDPHGAFRVPAPRSRRSAERPSSVRPRTNALQRNANGHGRHASMAPLGAAIAERTPSDDRFRQGD